MSDRSQFQILFGYHWQTTSRLLDGAARLTEADYTDNPGHGHGSIHDLFLHVLRTDQSWRIGLQTGRQASAMKPERRFRTSSPCRQASRASDVSGSRSSRS